MFPKIKKRKIWWGIITVKNNFFNYPFNYQFNRYTNNFRSVGQSIHIISFLENDKMDSDIIFRLLFREQLDSINSSFVRFNFLFFINFKTAFTLFSNCRVLFLSVIQTNFINNKLVEISHTETSHSGRNNRPQLLERFQIFRQTETRPVYFKFFNHRVKMTIHKAVISDKVTNNRTAIFKTRTNERTLPVVKKT